MSVTVSDPALPDLIGSLQRIAVTLRNVGDTSPAVERAQLAAGEILLGTMSYADLTDDVIAGETRAEILTAIEYAVDEIRRDQ